MNEKQTQLDTSKVIVVVEPHADDAFLSVGAHIEEWIKKQNSQVWIWTFFSSTRKRGQDAKAYADAVGAGWVGSPFTESDSSSRAEPITVPLGMLNLPWDIESTQFIIPLAILHKEHVAVREYVEKHVDNAFYYLDQPYAITQKNGEVITNLLSGMKVVSYRKPGARKYRHIPLFKDQGRFFYYNDVEKLMQTCELIVQ